MSTDLGVWVSPNITLILSYHDFTLSTRLWVESKYGEDGEYIQPGGDLAVLQIELVYIK